MMLKKKNVIALATVASLFIGVAANAAVNGPYIGGTIGWGDTHQGGFADVGPGIGSSSKDTGLAGRIDGGYLFTENFAAELGYTRFHNSTAKAYSSAFATNGTIKEDAFDLVGKAILPLSDCFNLYGKLGAAYLRANGTVTGSSAGTAVRVSENAHKVYPTFGLGAGYNINKNITADVSWNRIQKVGNNNNLPSTDLVGVGLSYNFG